MVESFLHYLQFEKRTSRLTVNAYQNDLHQFHQFLSETYKLDNRTDADEKTIKSWIVSLVDQGLDPRSVNRKIASLRSYFKFLLREGLIEKDPLFRIRVLKTKKKIPHFVSENDLNVILDQQPENTFDYWRQQLVMELLYGTGIRLAELISLKDKDIDLASRCIRVLGKRNKERVIPFSAGLVKIIEGYLRKRNDEVARDGDFLIVTDKGKPCYPMLIYRIVHQKLLQANTEKKSPHVLRHSYATHLLDKGAEINAVKDLLGHSSLAATQVYTHNSIEKLKKVFDQAHPKA